MKRYCIAGVQDRNETILSYLMFESDNKEPSIDSKKIIPYSLFAGWFRKVKKMTRLERHRGYLKIKSPSACHQAGREEMS